MPKMQSIGSKIMPDMFWFEFNGADFIRADISSLYRYSIVRFYFLGLINQNNGCKGLLDWLGIGHCESLL